MAAACGRASQICKGKRAGCADFSSERGRQKFLKLIEQDGIYPHLRYDVKSKGIFALIAAVHHGTELVWENMLIIPEELLQPKTNQSKRQASQAFKGLDSYNELMAGDLLVHRDYGIGRFGGLHRMTVGALKMIICSLNMQTMPNCICLWTDFPLFSVSKPPRA